MSELEVQAGPVVKVASDLSEIARLAEDLEAQALSHADDVLMPGGMALVALAPVGNHDVWVGRVSLAERSGYEAGYTDEDPDEQWTALQLLRWWSDDWRREWGVERDGQTLATEVAFLKPILGWVYDHELHFNDFARDVKRARAKLENVLYAGERAERGVPCLYDGCGGKRLVRKMEAVRGKEGCKAWVWSNWHCPSCHREWGEDQYVAMVTLANEETKTEIINGEEWCAVDKAARNVDRSRSTIRQWVHKGHVAQVCIIAGRRLGFVRMADVVARHEAAARRKRAA